MRVTSETDLIALGVIVLDGIALPADYDPPPTPDPGGDRTPARRLYRAIGIDPTRYRPSSEALARRIAKGGDLPRINALVDHANFCSVSLMLPFGGYDLAKVAGDVVLRIGRPGERYEGIGKPDVSLDGRYVLADDEGPFGNPTSDSFRTRITPETTRALITIFAPAGDPIERLAFVADRLTAAVGGTATTEIVA